MFCKWKQQLMVPTHLYYMQFVHEISFEKNTKKSPIWYICNNFKFLWQISMKLCKKIDNHVINPTAKKIFMKIEATQENW